MMPYLGSCFTKHYFAQDSSLYALNPLPAFLLATALFLFYLSIGGALQSNVVKRDNKAEKQGKEVKKKKENRIQ